MSDIDIIAELFNQAKRIVVLTGAGVSKESGIPTFRDSDSGLWSKYDPTRLASPQGFLENPALVWQWYDMRRQMLAKVQPNPGHYAIAELEALKLDFTLITQNVDGLHRLAGSRNILELHGNIQQFYCFERGHAASDVPFGLTEPPVCHCGSLLRPAVVWFGEALPKKELRIAFAQAQQGDLMFVVGTSALVHPAASLPLLTKQYGGKIIEVNPEETAITKIADVFIKRASGEALPELVAALKALSV